jgi:hypothetical protein
MGDVLNGRWMIPWVGGLLLAVAMAACGGGGGGEADITARSISDADLGTMAVYEVDLPEEFAGFVRTGESGFKTNDQSAEGHFDPADEAEDLELFGQVREYVRAYGPPEADGAVPQGEAISFISGARLFNDAAGASGYLEDELADIQGSVGKEIDGATIEEVKRLKVGGIGDEAVGVRTTLRLRNDSEGLAYGTQVSFRLGRLLLTVAMTRTDDKDVRSELEALARSLDERIRVVLQATPLAGPTATQ